MMSSGVSPLSSVFLNSHAISSATTMPSRYIESIVMPESFQKPNSFLSGIVAAISTA